MQVLHSQNSNLLEFLADHVDSAPKTRFPEGGYPADIRRISGGYPADIRRISGGYPADIRAPEESSGWIFRDVTDESGRISLPIGRNREESGDGRSGRTGPRPPPLSSLFQPMGREMRPRRHGKSIRRTPPEGGYPPDFRRISAGYPPDIRRVSAGYPASGKRVLGPDLWPMSLERCFQSMK